MRGSDITNRDQLLTRGEFFLHEESENDLKREFSSVDEVSVEEKGVGRRRLPDHLEDVQQVVELSVDVANDDEGLGESDALERRFVGENWGDGVDDCEDGLQGKLLFLLQVFDRFFHKSNVDPNFLIVIFQSLTRGHCCCRCCGGFVTCSRVKCCNIVVVVVVALIRAVL